MCLNNFYFCMHTCCCFDSHSLFVFFTLTGFFFSFSFNKKEVVSTEETTILKSQETMATESYRHSKIFASDKILLPEWKNLHKGAFHLDLIAKVIFLDSTYSMNKRTKERVYYGHYVRSKKAECIANKTATMTTPTTTNGIQNDS